MKSIKLFVRSTLVFILAAYSCANRVPVDGGPRDTTPPRIVKSVPDSAERNFNQKKLYFTFDEYIDLKDAGSSILFSPPLLKPAEFVVRKKTLEVTLPDSLEKNTTYTISFGKSVVDVNEGNVFKNQFRVFSTGPDIDSLQLSGKLLNALTGKPLSGAKALIYQQMTDTTPYKQYPRYFALSDEAGDFTVQNIKQGDYYFVAQTDNNANLLFDNPDDLIGFIAEKISMDSTTSLRAPVRMFRNQSNKQKILKKNFELPGKLILKTAKPLLKPAFRLLAPFESDSVLSAKTEKDDSLLLFLPRFKSDSLWLQVSDGNYLDTVKLNLRGVYAKAMQKGKSAVDTSFSIKSGIPNNALSVGDTFRLQFNRPLKSLDKNRILLTKDSTSIPFDVSLNNLSARLVFPFSEGEQFQLTLLPFAFFDKYDRKNDTLRYSIKVNRDKDLGSASIKLSGSQLSKKGVLQLLSTNGSVLKQITVSGDGKFEFQSLPPGVYTLRLIDDANENGRWDTGSFEQQIQPEKTYNFSEPITIRAGWDVENEWNLSELPTKSGKPLRK